MELETQIRSRWNMLRGQVQQKWGKLTDQDLDVVQGNLKELVGKIEHAYGVTRDRIEDELHALLGHASDESRARVEAGAEKAKASIDRYEAGIEKKDIA